jgi:hypothetical protein
VDVVKCIRAVGYIALRCITRTGKRIMFRLVIDESSRGKRGVVGWERENVGYIHPYGEQHAGVATRDDSKTVASVLLLAFCTTQRGCAILATRVVDVRVRGAAPGVEATNRCISRWSPCRARWGGIWIYGCSG